jgi:hypothetical protein
MILNRVLFAAAGVVTAVTIAACGGGGGGHSKSYDLGFKAGDGFNELQLATAGPSCGLAYMQGAGGTNENEFLQGCAEAAVKHGATVSPTDSGGN